VHEKDNILKDLARRFLERDLFKAYQFNNEEEFQSLKQNALAKLKLRDMNPEYYIDRISIAAKPYSFYNPDKTNFSKAIFVQDQDSDELQEISEVSPIVNSMVKNNFQNQYLISI
jgi:HD superfamily phosphohydrolase